MLVCRGAAMLREAAVFNAVIPGDRREARDPCLSLSGRRSGMDPGSSLRSARYDPRSS